MKTKEPNLLGPALRDYFADHLPRLRGMSPNTIQSYRDSLVLLLRYVACARKRTVADLDLSDIDPKAILAFLSYLQSLSEKAAIETGTLWNRAAILRVLEGEILRWLGSSRLCHHWRGS